jgi:small subunit ribosomal protein S6
VQLNDYEMMVIMNPDLDEEGFAAELERLQTRLTDAGGQVQKVDVMGRRRLAYPIRKRVEGYYAVIWYQLSISDLPELERWLKLNENVLRYLNVRPEE